MTARQLEVLRRVLRHQQGDLRWYRAAGSGERVTLASLYRRGALQRRVRRGAEGAADAAYEYRIADTISLE